MKSKTFLFAIGSQRFRSFHFLAVPLGCIFVQQNTDLFHSSNRHMSNLFLDIIISFCYSLSFLFVARAFYEDWMSVEMIRSSDPSVSSSSSSSSSGKPLPLALRRPFKFVVPEGTDTELYECPICMELYHDPVQHAYCGGVACRQCFIDAKWKCPGCNKKVTNSDLVRINSKITNKLDEFDVKCNECSTTMKYRSWSSHQKDGCEVECPGGCGKKMKKTLIESHQRSECPEASVVCESVNVMYQLGIANKCLCRWTGKRKSEKSHACVHANVMQFLVPAAENNKKRRTPLIFKGMKVDCKFNSEPWQIGEVLDFDQDGLCVNIRTGNLYLNLVPLGTYTNRDSSSSSSSARNARRIERLIDMDEESAELIALEDDIIEEIDPFLSSSSEEDDDAVSHVERLISRYQNENDDVDEPAPAPVVVPAGRRDTFVYRREGSQFLFRLSPTESMKAATLISRRPANGVIVSVYPYNTCSEISRSDPRLEIRRPSASRRSHLIKFVVGGVVGVTDTLSGRVTNKKITAVVGSLITLENMLIVSKSDPILKVSQRAGIRVYEGSLVELIQYGSTTCKAIVCTIDFIQERIKARRFNALTNNLGSCITYTFSEFEDTVRV